MIVTIVEADCFLSRIPLQITLGMGSGILLLSCKNMDDQQEGTAPVSPAVPERVQEIAKDELERTKQPMQKVEIQSLNTRAYLDHTVVPILMDAMTAVAKDRYRATPNEALVQPCKHARIRIAPWRFSLLLSSSDLQTLSSLLLPSFCRTRRSISSTDTVPQIDKFFPYLLRGHTRTRTNEDMDTNCSCVLSHYHTTVMSLLYQCSVLYSREHACMLAERDRVSTRPIKNEHTIQFQTKYVQHWASVHVCRHLGT